MPSAIQVQMLLSNTSNSFLHHPPNTDLLGVLLWPLWFTSRGVRVVPPEYKPCLLLSFLLSRYLCECQVNVFHSGPGTHLVSFRKNGSEGRHVVIYSDNLWWAVYSKGTWNFSWLTWIIGVRIRVLYQFPSEPEPRGHKTHHSYLNLTASTRQLF